VDLVHLQSFLTIPLDAVDWLASCRGRFKPRAGQFVVGRRATSCSRNLRPILRPSSPYIPGTMPTELPCSRHKLISSVYPTKKRVVGCCADRYSVCLSSIVKRLSFRIVGGYALCPPSGILNTRKHDVSENGSLSVLTWRKGGAYSVGSLGKC
jgi:hypothetical protein